MRTQSTPVGRSSDSQAPAVQVVHEILKDKGHPHRLAAAKEILERNRLYASGVALPQRGAFQPAVSE